MIEPTDEVKGLARIIAFWHGATIARGGVTVGTLHGFGAWGHSAELYAQKHWPEYILSAEAMVRRLVPAMASE